MQEPVKRAPITATASILMSLAILGMVSPGVEAQTFDGFGPSNHYDQGYNPSVAINNGVVVEVHNAVEGAGPLWYRVGKVTGSTVTWNDSHQYENNGNNPTVALAGNVVVEVHNGDISAGPLWYRVGTLSGTFINWSDSHQYDDHGNNPSVAVVGNVVIETHNGGLGAGPLWYRMGSLNGSTIDWNDSYKFDSYSTDPSVAATPCLLTTGQTCGVWVVEVHNSNTHFGPLWYRIGNSLNGYTIGWQNPVAYDSGWNPKISISGNLVLEVHNGQVGAGPMWYHTGTFPGLNSLGSAAPIAFGPSRQYDSGNNPSVALDSAAELVEGATKLPAVEVHNGVNGVGPEWDHVGTYTFP